MPAKKKVDALTIKPGPTESGAGTITRRAPTQIGGDLLPDNLSLLLSQYWFLAILLMLPLGFLLFKKRDLLFGLLTKIRLI